jgi:hypothetical protein
MAYSTNNFKPLQAAIKKSALYWQDKFGLKEWDIHYCLDLDHDQETADAYVELTTERSHAVVSVSPDVELEDVDYLICHELLHVLKAQRKSILRINIEALNVDTSTKAALLGVMNVMEEQDVNSIAKAFCSVKPSSKKKGKKNVK